MGGGGGDEVERKEEGRGEKEGWRRLKIGRGDMKGEEEGRGGRGGGRRRFCSFSRKKQNKTDKWKSGGGVLL